MVELRDSQMAAERAERWGCCSAVEKDYWMAGMMAYATAGGKVYSMAELWGYWTAADWVDWWVASMALALAAQWETLLAGCSECSTVGYWEKLRVAPTAGSWVKSWAACSDQQMAERTVRCSVGWMETGWAETKVVKEVDPMAELLVRVRAVQRAQSMVAAMDMTLVEWSVTLSVDSMVAQTVLLTAEYLARRSVEGMGTLMVGQMD